MISRILATISVAAIWIVLFTALDDHIPLLASYARELQSKSDLIHYLIQSLSSNHAQLPSVLSFMTLATLWAPIIDDKLAAKGR